MIEDENNNDDSNGGEERLKLQESDEDVYDKMKLHEKMYDEANAWGVSLGINKKVLRVRWRRPPRERKRSYIGEADGVRAIFRRSKN